MHIIYRSIYHRCLSICFRFVHTYCIPHTYISVWLYIQHIQHVCAKQFYTHTPAHTHRDYTYMLSFVCTCSKHPLFVGHARYSIQGKPIVAIPVTRPYLFWCLKTCVDEMSVAAWQDLNPIKSMVFLQLGFWWFWISTILMHIVSYYLWMSWVGCSWRRNWRIYCRYKMICWNKLNKPWN